MKAGSPELSVVIATYNRRARLERLLRQLASQTLPTSRYEVVVVDDGSKEPVARAVASLGLSCQVRVEEQPNAGAATARHRGALAARGRLLLVVDDDMQVGSDFLEAHATLHPPGSRNVVLGRIRADPNIRAMPLFERWHATILDRMAADLGRPGAVLRGNHLYTGNVSLRREDYLAVGGFDPALGHSEDAELGLRLEKAGVHFLFSDRAVTFHGSDHTDLASWKKRAIRYGVFDSRIARKHPELPHADPWRFLFELSPASRPLLAASLVSPAFGRALSEVAMATAERLGRVGLERAALSGTTLVYGLEYFRGVRAEAGGLPAALAGFVRHAKKRGSNPMKWTRRLSLLPGLWVDVQADHQVMRQYEEKYGHHQPSSGSGASDLVQKIGFQLMAGYRLMRFLYDADLPLGAKVASRLLRHVYGSDIHWEAELAPGVMVVHGMGLAISHDAKVGQGSILFQHVTLGEGTHPVTRKLGAPTVEENVHIGPGATLIGPITIGAGSKIMAGAVVTESVPPGSLVESPAPRVTARRAPGATGRRAKGKKQEPAPTKVDPRH